MSGDEPGTRGDMLLQFLSVVRPQALSFKITSCNIGFLWRRCLLSPCLNGSLQRESVTNQNRGGVAVSVEAFCINFRRFTAAASHAPKALTPEKEPGKELGFLWLIGTPQAARHTAFVCYRAAYALCGCV